MRKLLLPLLISTTAWAKPVVLLGHFDAFGNSYINNATEIALELVKRNKDHPDFELKLCELKTVFDKSYYQLEDCLKALPEAPKMVLGLGEANCNIKIETMGRNLDNTKGPDNEGIERKNEIIIPGAPAEFGFNYPLPQMYCALAPKERNLLEVSNNAGSFVCNNLAYQFSYKYQDTVFGFIHVPAHNCRDISERSEVAIDLLTKMITAAVKTEETARLSTTKDELVLLRRQFKHDRCLSEFYKRTKGADEKGIWPF